MVKIRQTDVDHAIRPYSGTAVATLANDSTRRQPAAYWRQIVAWVMIEAGHRPCEVATILRRKESGIEAAHLTIEKRRREDPEVMRLTDRLLGRALERAMAGTRRPNAQDDDRPNRA